MYSGAPNKQKNESYILSTGKKKPIGYMEENVASETTVIQFVERLTPTYHINRIAEVNMVKYLL